MDEWTFFRFAIINELLMYGVKTKWSVDYDLDCEQSLFFRHKQSNLEVRAAKLQSLNC